MNQVIFSDKSNEITVTEYGIGYSYEYIVSKTTKTVAVNFKGRTDVVEVPAYRLEVGITEVHPETETELQSYVIDFGALTNRNGVIRHLVSKLSRRSITSVDNLRALIAKEMKGQDNLFYKEAVRLFKKQLGVFHYSPFDRDKLAKEGLVEAHMESSDEEGYE